MISRTKVGTALAVLSLAALTLTACTGANNGTGAAACTPPASSEGESVPGTGWESADRDAVADGGTLSLAVDNTPANWNLNNLDSGTVDDNTLAGVFLPSFITLAEDGTWEANPDFATTVELVSEEPQVVQVTINPAAVWSDGTPIGVQDFAATWGALNGVNPDFAPIATNVWSDIVSVEAGANDQDVIITFGNANADWPSILGAIWPRWLMDTPEHFNTLWASGPYAADGTTYVSGSAYVLGSFDPTGQVATFVPNPQWWGDEPKLDQIIFKAVARDGIASAFANNELDVANVYGNADSYATVQGRSDAVVQRSQSTTYRHITLNGTSEVFSDVKIRQAFAQSLDRAVIAEARLKGVESPVTLLDNLIFLPGQAGYEDDATDVIGCDIESASALIEDAGYTINDEGYAEKDGTVLTVRFVIPSDNPNSAEVAQQVQAMAKVTGFQVDIDVVPSDDFFTSYITTETRDFDATYFAWQGTAFPISSTESIFYPADSGQNFPGVTDDSLGPDWDAANAELDPEARLELAKEIDKKLVGLVTTVPLFPETYVYGVKDGLVNYGPTQFQSIDWQDVGFTE